MKYYRIVPFKKYSALEEAEIVSTPSSKPPKDWAFMKESGKVLDNIPDTWKAYPDNEQGRLSIINMEYNEFMKAATREDRMHELVHLASSCLHLWRMYNDAE